MVMNTLDTRDISDKSRSKLNWNVKCSDEGGDEEQLTSLVRNSYLKHLKHCISKNYEKWYKTNISIDELNFCSEMLEERALRACMITSIYQRSMSQIIKEIKEATQHEMLHEGFRHKLDKFQNIKCDKETQTLDTSALPLSVPSLLPLPLPPSTTNKQANFCETDELLNNNSSSSCSNSKTLFLETFGETEASINLKLQKDENGVDSYEELLNILLSSPQNQNTIQERELDIYAKNEVKPKSNKKRKLLNGNNGLSCAGKTPEELIMNTDITEPPSLDLFPVFESTVTSQTCEEQSNSNPKLNTPLINWSYELFIQNTHLENLLAKLKPYKRLMAEKRFKDLFGNDIIIEKNTKFSNISEEELNACRKRIARIIVGELTPYYIEGKIGSRPVFKNLAKKLTDDVLCTTLTPDPMTIRNNVRKLFEDGKQVNSLKDVF